MNMKRTMAAVLSAALLCTGGLAAIATNTVPKEVPAASEQQNLPSILGSKMKVTEVTLKSGEYSSITVQPMENEDSNPIRLNLSEQTVCIDTQSGLAANLEAIKEGDEIYAYYSAAMTRSIPPQASAYALVVNLKENASPAHYLVAEEVKNNDDGSVTVLAENGTILVTITSDTPISPYQTKNIVKNTDIVAGSRFFAWYDQVALSMPGQAHATRAVLLPETVSVTQTDDASPTFQPVETAPYRFGIQGTITESKDSAITIQTKDENNKVLVLNLSEDTIVLDTQTGLPASSSTLAKGQTIYAYYGSAMTASEPAQVSAEAILVNLDDAHAPARLLTAESITRNPDGSVTLLTDSGSLYLSISKDAQVSPYRTKNIASLNDIHMGTKLFAWYDVVAESYPAQASTNKVVLVPSVNQEFSMVLEGDMVIGHAKMENGVLVAPLRQVAEALGFTVTWNGAERSIHLTNGVRQSTIYLGKDSYAYSTANKDLIGMSAPISLGFAPHEENGTTYAPVELFNLLLENSPVVFRGDTLYL